MDQQDVYVGGKTILRQLVLLGLLKCSGRKKYRVFISYDLRRHKIYIKTHQGVGDPILAK